MKQLQQNKLFILLNEVKNLILNMKSIYILKSNNQMDAAMRSDYDNVIILKSTISYY